MTVASTDPEGSFGVCAAELKLSLHHGPVHLTWSAASPKFGPGHPCNHGRTCAIHVMQLASMDKFTNLHCNFYIIYEDVQLLVLY